MSAMSNVHAIRPQRPEYPSDERVATPEGIAVGYRILEACREAGIAETQGDIAKAMNVSQMTVSYWLRGMKVPPIQKGMQIAAKCKVCVEWLYTGKGPKYPSIPNEMILLAQKFSESSPRFKSFIRKMMEQPDCFD